MKNKLPEITATVLTIIAFLYPPWRVYFLSDPLKYDTEWEFIFSDYRTGSIDIALLGLEMVAIAGLYFLFRKIVDKGTE